MPLLDRYRSQSAATALLILVATPLWARAAAGVARGVIYDQPSYHYTNTDRLDLTVAESDFRRIAAQGFVHVGLRVSWGEVMSCVALARHYARRRGGDRFPGGLVPSVLPGACLTGIPGACLLLGLLLCRYWNTTTRQATYNESFCTKLGLLESMAGRHNLKLIFNMHLKEHVPRGLDGIMFRPPKPDIANVSGGAGGDVWASVYPDLVLHNSYKEPILLFHEKMAECLRPGRNVLYWKHAFESMYMFPAGNIPHSDVARSQFAAWARTNNSSIGHWAGRWAQGNLSSFQDIDLPDKAANKEKLGDFWRFWLLGVLKEGTYGLSVGEVRRRDWTRRRITNGRLPFWPHADRSAPSRSVNSPWRRLSSRPLCGADHAGVAEGSRRGL